jgi:Xaa-Pro aminopeptidase
VTGPSRVERARALLAQLDVDALLVSRTANKRWLANFILQPAEEPTSGFSGTLLLTADRQIVLADPRYVEQATADCAGWELVQTANPLEAELPPLLGDMGVARLGAEAEALSHAHWQALADAAPGVILVPSDGPMQRLRLGKDAGEIAALERACALTDACFAHLVDTVRPGMTERDVAWELEGWFRSNGADGIAFDPLVLVGARAAMPHGRTADVAVHVGEPLLIDFGCAVDGYRSDMTRTVFIGSASDRARELYAHVLAAQEAAFAAARVGGVIGSDVHRAALAVLEAAGLGEAFTHGLGHGIGLETHEDPRLKTWHEPLEAGMVFTLEPGVYLPGEIGIRIEDDIHLTDDGPRCLTAAPRDLIVI